MNSVDQDKSTIVTRFAPSPTGKMHIGGARTALFNWLFARANNGTFLLRIEDTDRLRSSDRATEQILADLRWLGLNWDREPISQRERVARHVGAARELLSENLAYRCFSTPDEIATARKEAEARGKPTLFQSPWRNTPESAQPDLPCTIRLKTPETGVTRVEDAIHGSVSWKNETLDDMIILRSDGSPTYNFAVVVDDHDMGISHVIRGDDHLSNTARQSRVYDAFGWKLPKFAHIPLILSESGKKLSKRDGDLGIDHFRELGFTPESVLNYLARLGWSHGDDECFGVDQAVEWFSLEGLGKSPARLNQSKLRNISLQHMKISDEAFLADEVLKLRNRMGFPELDKIAKERLLRAIPILKMRSATLIELNDSAGFAFLKRPIEVSDHARSRLDHDGLATLSRLLPDLEGTSWSRAELEITVAKALERESMPYGRIAAPLRISLTGLTKSPSIIDVMIILGKLETIGRIQDVT